MLHFRLPAMNRYQSRKIVSSATEHSYGTVRSCKYTAQTMSINIKDTSTKCHHARRKVHLYHRPPLKRSFKTGRLRRRPPATVTFLAIFRGCSLMISSVGEKMSSGSARLPVTRIIGGAKLCMLSAPVERGRIHPFPSIKEKNSANSGAACSVFLDPNMMSFERARVNATFILRQSFRRSPICCSQYQPRVSGSTVNCKVSHLARIV